MSLTRAASSAPAITPEARALSTPAHTKATEPTLPPHVLTFLGMLKTHFESARDSRPWDQHDTRAYGKVVLQLSGDECRSLMDRLRAKHHWRPSVAQVSEALAELLEKIAPERVLTGAEVAMRTVHAMPRALPSAANGPGRERARREHQRRRAAAGLTPARKPENQAPARSSEASASAPTSLVGLLVVAMLEDGRDIGGVVWEEDADKVLIKARSMKGTKNLWVDKSRIRLEVPRDLSGGAS